MTIQSLDTQLLLLINRGGANPLFDLLMPALSSQGYLLVLPFFFLMIYNGVYQKNARGKGYLAAALWTIVICCIAVVFAEWVVDALKLVFARERPCRTVEGIRLITTCPKSLSLPSSHAMSSFSCAIPLFYSTRAYLARSWRLFPVILASLIAFSRIYLGVHYPSDVLAGALLGAGTGMALSVVWRMIAMNYISKGEQTPDS